MGTQFLIDTNVVLDFLTSKLPSTAEQWMQQLVRSQQYRLSVISRIELLGHPSVTDSNQPVAVFVAESLTLPLNEPVILETIRLRQLHKKKLPDGIIAATALVHGLTIVTRNVTDFANIGGLLVVNPHDVAGFPSL